MHPLVQFPCLSPKRLLLGLQISKSDTPHGFELNHSHSSNTLDTTENGKISNHYGIARAKTCA